MASECAFAGTRRVRELGQASAAGVASARGLADMYAAAAGGVDGAEPLLHPGTAADFAMAQTPGVDLVTGEADHFALGFEAQHVRYPVLSRRAFGHSGAAGTHALADPGAGFAYAYVRRRFGARGGAAPENDRILRAVVAAVPGRGTGTR